MRNKHLFPIDIENQAIVPGFLQVYVQNKETEISRLNHLWVRHQNILFSAKCEK